MKSKNMKLNRLIILAIAGLPFAFTAFAEEGAAANSTEAAEIQALKQEVRELEQKVQALEQRHAAEQQASADTSKEQIQALGQKVRVLERLRENDQDAAATVAKAQPKFSLGASGFSFSSADSNFVASLHGVVQVDSRTFRHDNNVPGNDSILLRRARPILSGTVYHDFDFLFVPEFGGGTPGSSSAATTPSIYDAYVNYRYSPAFQIQAGKFKAPVGLEQLQSDVNLSFNERSLVTDLVPNRDIGFELHGDIAGGVLSYAAGVFNGVGDARNSANIGFQDNREFDGRLFVQPFKKSQTVALQNLGIGVGGSWGTSSITNTLGLPASTGGSSTSAGYFTDGQQQFFAYNPASGGVVANGTHWRLSPQAYYYYGPFGLLGEYAISDQGVKNSATLKTADLRNTAWDIAGGWVLTGEDAAFNGVTPRHPFNPRNGDWGALQLVARYAELDVDKAAFPAFANPATSASEAHAWAVGLNWYLNKNIRVNTSFSRTTFTGGGGAGTTVPAAVTQHPEDVFFTRVQLSF